MDFIDKLQRAFSQFQSMLIDDQNADILELSYAEFTLKCYVGYSQRLYDTILQENAPLAKAFRAIGIEQPRDQLLMLLDTFYLSLRTSKRPIN